MFVSQLECAAALGCRNAVLFVLYGRLSVHDLMGMDLVGAMCVGISSLRLALGDCTYLEPHDDGTSCNMSGLCAVCGVEI